MFWKKKRYCSSYSPDNRMNRVRSTGPGQKQKKIKAVQGISWHFWLPPHPLSAPNFPNTSERLGDLIFISLEQVLVRERGERSGNKQVFKLESKLPAGRSQVESIYFNVFRGISLRNLDVFHYFHVWGTQICRENILFRTKRPSF